MITDIDGTTVGSPAEMQEAISRYRPGEKVTVTYFRNGDLQKIRVLLLDKENLATNRQLVSSEVREDLLDRIGLEVQPLSKKEKLEKETGLRVTAVYINSIAAASNLEAGYLITEVNGQPVYSKEGLTTSLLPGREIQLKGFYPKVEEAFYYQFKVPD